MPDVLIAQLPSTRRRTVFREWAGGMGTALASARKEYGHDQKYYDIPYSAYLYIARRLEQMGFPFAYRDFQAAETLPLADFDAAVAAAAPKILITQVNLPSLGADLELLAHARAAAPGLKIVLL